jgi:mevalonate kinase
MGYGFGNGKIILFGEHFVVHGAPAIAAGISNSSIVEIYENSTENKIITDLKVVPKLSIPAITSIATALKINKTFDVHLTGDLPTYGGLGSSAAFSVALVRAFSNEYGLNLTDKEVNQIAYEGEKSFHGNPSGLDNLAATYGGIIQFTRGSTPSENTYKHISSPTPLNFTVSFSGKYGATVAMVEKVRKFKETNPSIFDALLSSYNSVFNQGKESLPNPQRLGPYLDANHALLVNLGVVDKPNEQIVTLARKNGALGAKLTGGGGGGCCIALAKDESHAKEMASIIDSAGFPSFSTTVKSK